MRPKAVPASVKPAFTEPPHLILPGGDLAIWFTEPLGMLTQLRRPAHAGIEYAEFIAEFAYATLLELREEERGRMFFIHDFSLLEGYDSEARRILTMWSFRIRDQIERVVVVQPPVNELVRLGVSAVASALGLMGIRFEVVDDVAQTIDALGLTPRPQRPSRM